jgi:hypothetical protein
MNNLAQLSPGNGYMIYMSNNGTLTYPANGSGRVPDNECKITPEPKYLIPEINNTGNSANIMIKTEGIIDGNEIGIWDSKGTLIGSGVVNDGITAMTIWGADNSKETVGAYENELLTIKLFNVQSQNYSRLINDDINDMTDGSNNFGLVYKQNGIFVANCRLSDASNSVSDYLNVYPNPFNQKTTVEILQPQNSNFKLELFDMQGIKVMDLKNAKFDSQENKVVIDGSTLASGVYNLVLTTDTGIVTKMISLIK